MTDKVVELPKTDLRRRGGRAERAYAALQIDKALAAANALKFGKVSIAVDWEDLWWYHTPPCEVTSEYGSCLLIQMPGCCGIGIVSGTYSWNGDDPDFAKFRTIVETLAKEMRYGAVVWTHVEYKYPKATPGYTRDFVFKNPKSTNEVFLEHKVLG